MRREADGGAGGDDVAVNGRFADICAVDNRAGE